MPIDVLGFIAPGYERVYDAFAANFERKEPFRDVGASFAAYRGQELIADLSAGFRDSEGTVRWTNDSLINIWSSTKGVVGLIVAVLVERGLLTYDAPASRYWPEFGQHGKDGITVSQILSHQAGLPGFDEPTSIMDL